MLCLHRCFSNNHLTLYQPMTHMCYKVLSIGICLILGVILQYMVFAYYTWLVRS